jgi:ribonuclease HII
MGVGAARMVRGVDERWQRAVTATSRAGVVARLVFSTGTPARGLRSVGLISESELADYEAIPMERRAVWEQTDLLEKSRLRVLGGGGDARTSDDRAPGVSTNATGGAVSKPVNHFPSLLAFDLATGVRLVAGADESGRACLAGPLVAAACLFDWKSLNDAQLYRLARLRDSKKVTPTRRRELRTVIRELAVSVAVSVISPAEIDRDGLDVSNLRALREAVSQLEPAPGVCFTDWYTVLECRYATTRLEGGDNTSAAVAAASIIAKTTRDEMMAALATEYHGYGFERHKGYINETHVDAIRRLGITPHHRKSFDAAIYREIGLPR